MSVDQSRRSLLFGRKPVAQSPVVFRPPWAIAQFGEHCTRCNACVEACPTRMIVRGDGGFPELDFTRGECNFCGECRTACPTPALSAAQPWQQAIVIEIANRCLAEQGVECRVCGESCDARAIRFILQPGKVAQPQLDPEACTGCGACIAPCPSQAIGMIQTGKTA
ncbi:ferredoxin-type protein NapF [Chitinibacter sp. GC72]|uniref:ferredoxin-type protein NapF n=1 Tax=Chitinibacter sp. GC72 TaxID=1526917 RepID=UPI0012FC14BC|nr:ferredoxin-type protein NapF [Chitinibacter sp. GC72]